MSRVIRVRYENGVFRPLEPVELREGEEAEVIVKTGEESIARKFYGIARKRRPGLSRNDFLRVLEEVENEDIRGF